MALTASRSPAPAPGSPSAPAQVQRRSRQATSRPPVWHGFGVTDRDPDDDVPPTPDSWRWRALDEITDVVVAVDSSGTIVYGNDFASHLLGHPRGWSYYATLCRKLHWNAGVA